MSARSTVVRLALGVVLGIAAIGTVSAAPEASETEIVIEATALRPPVLDTMVEDTVTFVNRSGRVVHVDFRHDSGYHSVFQVPGEIRAVFHRPGAHPYVVHFETGTGNEAGARGDLHGVVNVKPGTGPLSAEPTCRNISVKGVCLAP